MSMKLALNRAEMARESLIQAAEWLDAKGVYYRHLPPSQLKIGPINYWPSTGTITVDNETGKRPYLGLQGLDAYFGECDRSFRRIVTGGLRGDFSSVSAT